MTEIIERVAKAAGISHAKAALAIQAMREPTTEMWDHAENMSLMAQMSLEYADQKKAQKKAFDKAVRDDAYSFPTHRIWLGVVFWRAMIDRAISATPRSSAGHLEAARSNRA